MTCPWICRPNLFRDNDSFYLRSRYEESRFQATSTPNPRAPIIAESIHFAPMTYHNRAIFGRGTKFTAVKQVSYFTPEGRRTVAHECRVVKSMALHWFFQTLIKNITSFKELN